MVKPMPAEGLSTTLAAAGASGEPEWAGLSALPEGGAGSAASDAATYAFAVYAAQILTFVGGVVQKGLLGPRLIGDWTLATSLMVFVSILPLGMSSGATMQVPAQRGRGDYRTAAALADSAFSFTIVAFAFGGLLMAAIALVFGQGWSPQLRYGLLLLGLLAPLRSLADCHTLVYQITKRFRAAAAGVLLTGLIVLTAQTAFVYVIGYWGLFLGVAAATAGSLLLWRSMGLAGFRRPAFRFRVERSCLRTLLPIGVPIMALSQIWLLFMAVDSLLVARLLNATSLGYYALATSVTSYIVLMPKSIATALFSRMQERYAPRSDAAAIRRYATDVQGILALLVLPVLVGGAFFLVPALVRQVLPAFIPGIPALRILAAGSFLIALVNMPMEVLITTGRRWGVTSLLFACLVVNALANYVAMGVLGEGIRGAAVATASSYFVVMLTSSVYSLQALYGAAALGRHLAVVLGAFAYTIGSLWSVELAFRVQNNVAVGEDIGVALAKFAVFLVLMAPCFVVVERRYRALTIVRSLLSATVHSVRTRFGR